MGRDVKIIPGGKLGRYAGMQEYAFASWVLALAVGYRQLRTILWSCKCIPFPWVPDSVCRKQVIDLMTTFTPGLGQCRMQDFLDYVLTSLVVANIATVNLAHRSSNEASLVILS